MDYESMAYSETEMWKRKATKRSSMVKRFAEKAQDKVNQFIPEKAHNLLTESIKKMVQATLFGSEFLTKKHNTSALSLEEKEIMIKEKLGTYRRTATVEGAGTGAGGVLLGLADFPLLLSIKMKFLFEAAAFHGYDTSKYEERLFILYVFQLAFSSDKHRKMVLTIIENWEQEKSKLLDVDWRALQQEYRDHIDFVKMLQLVPGIGAAVGAFANYNLLEKLGETTIHAYRIRMWNNRKKIETE
ncbi:EcsC family protein [Bacillus sp. FJAT-49736]|nr:EcsC family protein [Bacillus sp. FJAT-49736]MBS4171889.1 EcsC family protein [Bacillus sp. FJAT-49736]